MFRDYRLKTVSFVILTHTHIHVEFHARYLFRLLEKAQATLLQLSGGQRKICTGIHWQGQLLDGGVKRARCRRGTGGASPVMRPLARRLAATWRLLRVRLCAVCRGAGLARSEAHDLAARRAIATPAASSRVRRRICGDVDDVGEGAVARRGDVDLEVAEDDDAAVERQRSAAAADAACVVDEELQVAKVGDLAGDDPLT